MKNALIVLLSCATFSMAQNMKLAPEKSNPAAPPQTQKAQPGDTQNQQDSQAAEPQFKRLASITYDLNTHKLTWIVEKGTEVDGQFVAQSQGKYEVSPAEGFMAVNEEKRGIENEEAGALHDLLGVLSMYCVESTVWWDHGGDDGASPASAPETTPDAKPAAPASKPGTKIEQRKGVDQPADKPGMKLIPGTLVAGPAIPR